MHRGRWWHHALETYFQSLCFYKLSWAYDIVGPIQDIQIFKSSLKTFVNYLFFWFVKPSQASFCSVLAPPVWSASITSSSLHFFLAQLQHYNKFQPTVCRRLSRTIFDFAADKEILGFLKLSVGECNCKDGVTGSIYSSRGGSKKSPNSPTL